MGEHKRLEGVSSVRVSMSEGSFIINKKKYFYVLSGGVLSWAAKKGAKKNDGECQIKPGSTVEASGDGIRFGSDSTGKIVEAAKDANDLQPLVDALKPLSEGEAEEEAFLRKGWLTREKKKMFFTLSDAGYLTWYQKEPNASIPHAKNFVKELTLNACTVSAKGPVVQLNKTTKTEKKTEEKLYALTAADDADAAAWVDALKKSIATAEELGLGSGERSKAGLGSRMKKGLAQKVATSKGGKSAAKKVLSPEVMGLLSALKQTFELYAGKQQAEELENAMIKIITKLYFAVDTKQVPIRDLLPADKYLREALKQISLVWGGRFRNALTRGQPPKEKEALIKVTENMEKIEVLLLKRLATVPQPKSISLIRSTLSFLKDHKYLTFVIEDDRLEEPRCELEQAIDQYNSIEIDVDSIEARLESGK